MQPAWPDPDRIEALRSRLGVYRERAEQPAPLVSVGKVTRVVGLTLEATGCRVPVGGRCEVVAANGTRTEAEVVGFEGDLLYLMPVTGVHGLGPDARVIPAIHEPDVPVGPEMLGRVIDGQGRPLDGLGPLRCEQRAMLAGSPINPLSRHPIDEPLDVGIRSVNALLSVGRGQRMGLFAGSGVGKSVLLGMMTRFTNADVVVVGLIGERGREVKEFVETTLGPDGMARAVVVATPADTSPVMRLHGAMLATSVAEYFRDRGQRVLLLMDSLTRFAQAQREIALAIGEPPATKGYPPSVFARLPQLVERAGNGSQGGGSITAFYTVLAEGDDTNDPIADAARAILDGHVVLSRRLADAGHFPAIDIEGSISRAMTSIVDPSHLQAARTFRSIYATYQQQRDLISVGAYQPGSDPSIDRAITLMPALNQFLQQDMNERVTLQESLNALAEVLRVDTTASAAASMPAETGRQN